MKYTKGETLESLPLWKKIPLFFLDHEAWSLLPRFSPPQGIEVCWKSSRIRDFVRGRLLELRHPIGNIEAAIVVALYLVDAGDYPGDVVDSDYPESRQEVKRDASFLADSQAGRNAWKTIKGSNISKKNWLRILAHVYCRLHIVESANHHPLRRYAIDVVPKLTQSEIRSVCSVLRLPYKRSSLGVQKLVTDSISSLPFAVLFEKTPQYAHSCVPSLFLEFKSLGDNEVSPVVTKDTDVLSLCWIQNHESFEQRDKDLQQRLEQSCRCIRCRYEMELPLYESKYESLLQLGHFYMLNDVSRARKVYMLAKSVHGFTAELCHALGACELAENRFLEAHRIWNQNPNSKPNSQLQIQVAKQERYEHFKPRSSNGRVTDPALSWSTSIPGVYVARVLDQRQCQAVIEMAEEHNQWTQDRHHEVPTFDMPIDVCPKLLQWFNGFMNDLQSLLAAQFNKEQCFYAHDAFVVRYRAEAVSNHLPIHTDESTHSFVLALNDSFEGGGTYFIDSDVTIRPELGNMISFRGDRIQHGGEPVTKGVRYILAVFLYSDDENEQQTCQCSSGRTAKRAKNDFAFCFDV